MTTTCYNLDHTFYFKTKEVSSTFLLETYPWILSLVEQHGEFLVTINPETCPQDMKDAFCYPILPCVPVKGVENATDTILLNMMRLKHPEHEQQINQLMTKSVFLQEKAFEFTSSMLVVNNNNITSKIKILADQIATLQAKNVELAGKQIKAADTIELQHECKQWEIKCATLEQTVEELKGHASKVAAKQKQLQKQRTQMEVERTQFHAKMNQMETNTAVQVSKLSTQHAAKQKGLQVRITQMQTERKQLQVKLNEMELEMRRMNQIEVDTASQRKVYKSVKKMDGALDNMNELRKAWDLYQTIPANTKPSVIEKALAFYHDHHESLHAMENKKKDLTMETERLKTNNHRERKIYKQLQQMFCQEELEDEHAAMRRLKNAWEWFKDKENAFDGLRKQLNQKKDQLLQMTEADLTCCILQHVFEPLISKFKSKTWNPKYHVDFINDKQMKEKQLDGYIRAITRRWLAPPTKIKANRSYEEKTKDYSHACAYRASFYHALDTWTNRVNFELEKYISLLGSTVPLTSDNVNVTVVNRTGNRTDCVENPLIVQTPRNMRAWQFNCMVQPLMNADEQFDGFIMNEDDTLVNANDKMEQHLTVYMVW